MKYRIGIDVGGTFTDAALIDHDTYELIDTVKIPTTHFAKAGVAEGIIQVLTAIMERNSIDPADVSFIAHGTTQATNALLEGDVVKVGIAALGSGLEGIKAKSDTRIGSIPLTGTKSLPTAHYYVDTSEKDLDEAIKKAVEALKDEGAKSIVAAEPFSVDDASNENKVVDICLKEDIPATATSAISKLYGLKVRTQTAVVNASIMPKMMEAACMTEDSIRKAGIKTPLMVMRCDGGVMTVEEVRKRPIMTILSGPAAGVAGALMYEKLTDGIFLEVGGTSTDISCVKNGKVQVKYAVIGGHKTFLTSLDVRTVGIGGGSMIQFDGRDITEVGPRSVHIAGMEYEVYASAEEIEDPVLTTVRPMDGDPDYLCVQCKNGRQYALSLSGAANIAGFIAEDDYVRGSIEAAEKAWAPLAARLGLTVKETALKALALSDAKNGPVVKGLMADYHMNPETTVLVGGGGGASVVIGHLAGTLGLKGRKANNAPVISTIGVALAMVRDMVERTIPNPSDKDIIRIRNEAKEKAVKAGADPETVEVQVEVDASRNLVRATAIGATELRSKDLSKARLDEEQLRKLAAENLGVDPQTVNVKAENGSYYVMETRKEVKRLFGLVKTRTTPIRVIDEEGVIRLQKQNGHTALTTGKKWHEDLPAMVDLYTDYNDGTRSLPNIYVINGRRIIDLSGLENIQRVVNLAGVELDGIEDDRKLIMICSARTD